VNVWFKKIQQPSREGKSDEIFPAEKNRAWTTSVSGFDGIDYGSISKIAVSE
jgi:hypothetical protein